MEQTKLVNLPLIGNVQHGEKIDNKVKEYGYFIAKTKNTHMQSYIEKFDKLFKGKQSIEIEFFCEEPLTKKYVRYNQSGEVCRCPENSNQATQKVKNGWQQIECKGPECQYRQKNEAGKCACNRIGWLKFLIPSISTDRIFLMKITGQTSINQLDNYIKLQKIQGKSIKGLYTLFLYQKEQTNSLCETHKNYLVDIVKKDEFDSNKPIPQNTQNEKELSTINTQNVNNEAEKQKITQITANKSTTSTIQKQTQNVETEKTADTKTTTKSETKTSAKKETKSKSKKDNAKSQDKVTETSEKTEKVDLDNCYALLRTFTKKIVYNGQPKEYTMGEFADMNDKISEIAVKPEDANELLECDLGTFVRLEIKDVGNIKFAVNLEFIEKATKKIAA